MIILGLESSCDETGVAIYDTSKGLLSDLLHSQIKMHQEYGGVVPELASRDHIRRLVPLIRQCLEQADCTLSDLDLIAYTQGPGLGGALLTASSLASGLAFALNKPLCPIHHLEGHLLSPMLGGEQPAFPYVALLVSGGHTQILKAEGVGRYELLGETVDDAAGEAFDKTASLLGLAYPGGPALAELAKLGNPQAFAFPRPMIRSEDLNMSFSGLKTAVALQCQKLGANGSGLTAKARADLAASFQAAVVEVLTSKSLQAMKRAHCSTLIVAGGVGANTLLRESLEKGVSTVNGRVLFPPLKLCTDNGAMIAFAAAQKIQSAGATLHSSADGFSIRPRWPLSQL